MTDREPMDVPAALWRRRGLILVLTLITLAAALIVSFTRPTQYTSTARVWVKPTAINPPGSVPITASLDMPTESELARSLPVAEIAAESLGSSSAEVLGHVTVTRPPDGLILEISFTAGSPETAQRGAQAVAEAYLRFRSGQAAAAVERAVEQAQQQISALQEEADDLARQTSGSDEGTTPAAPEAANRLEQVNGQIAIWQSAASVYNVAAVDAGSVIVPAPLPAAPSSPNHLADAIRGLLLGLVIGIVAALAAEAARARRAGT